MSAEVLNNTALHLGSLDPINQDRISHQQQENHLHDHSSLDERTTSMSHDAKHEPSDRGRGTGRLRFPKGILKSDIQTATLCNHETKI